MTDAPTDREDHLLELLALTWGYLNHDNPRGREITRLIGDRCVDCGHRWAYHTPQGCTEPRCHCTEPGQLP